MYSFCYKECAVAITLYIKVFNIQCWDTNKGFY